jgi:hypothetical protein
MTGPIKLSHAFLSPRKLVDSQNRTAWHVWKKLLKTRAFLIADKVGTGKSYIALSVAFGLWRKQRKRRPPFRILVIAGPSELSRAWLDKLVGPEQSTKADPLSRLMQRPGKHSYHEMYLRPVLGSSTPETYVYRLRHKFDASLLDELLKVSSRDKKRARLHTTTTKGRVEILVTSPRWIDKLQKRGSTRKWVRWCRNVDFIIADEIFAAKNPHTHYGRLLRRQKGDHSVSPWTYRRTPPSLLGLSATLLARDASDLRSLLNMLQEWSSSSDDVDLNAVTRAFVQTLRGIQRPIQEQSASAKAYRNAKNALEALCRPYIVRTPVINDRQYKFHATRLDDAGLLSADRAESSGEWPSLDGISSILQPLQERFSAAYSTPDSISVATDAYAWLIGAAVGTKDFRHRTRFVEGYSGAQTGHTETQHPKLSALQNWIRDFYLNAEAGWLRKDRSTFCFKLLIYVKHVDTARALMSTQKRIGRKIQNDLARQMVRTMQKIAKLNPDLFENGRLVAPIPNIQQFLGDLHVKSLADLSTHNRTAVLAALVNAHKENTTQGKLRRFRGTLAEIIRQDPRYDEYNRYIRVLSRYPALRHEILLKVGAASIVAAEAALKKEAKSTGRRQKSTPTLIVLDPTRIRLQRLREKIVRDLRSPKRTDFRKLDQMAIPGALSQLTDDIGSARNAVVRWIETDAEWLAQVKRWSRNPTRNLELLRRREEGAHRTPAIVAVQTGEDSGTRDHVLAAFRTVGNPYILVLTNVGTVGVDLHTYCWDILHYTPAWTPHEAEQKTGRIDRPRLKGQLRKLELGAMKSAQHFRVHYLIWPFTVDERIISRLNLRSIYADRLLGSKSALKLDDNDSDIAKRAHNYRPLNLAP